MNVNFNEVSIKARRTVFVDGKKKIQQRKFYQTLNPFNKNTDGTIKNRNDIIKELEEAILKWQKEYQ
ncbi:MAG: hypothetical protein WC464_00170 [Bdellovibrionales bacterium]|jgi:hypothetical protein